MPQRQTLISAPGESLTALSERVFNGDPLRFTEILELNPNLDVFADLPQELEVNIPDASQILNFAQPALTRISQSLGGAGRFLDQTSAALTQISGNLPPELQGYAQEAIDAIGEINGIREEVEQTIDGATEQIDSRLRSYQGQAVQLVQWLLGGR